MSDARAQAMADLEIARAVVRETRRRRAAGQGGVSDVHLAEHRMEQALKRAREAGVWWPDDDGPEAS